MRKRISGARRAIALVLALFATAILVILSFSFLMLARHEARNSASGAHEKLALESANFAMEMAINYMGQGKLGPESTWARVPHPDNFRFYNVLSVTPSPRTYLNRRIMVELADANIKARYGQGNSFISDNIRVLRQVDNNGNSMPNSTGSLAFTTRVVIIPVFSATEDNSYRLVTLSKLYSDTTSAVTPNLEPLATREIEAQIVPESVFSYLHFIENARGLVAPGRAPFDNRTYPNGSQGTVSPADFALIPPQYIEDGPMRVDGMDPSLASSNDPGKVTWLTNSGNLKFSADAKPIDQGGQVSFKEKLTIQKAANLYGNTDMSDANSGFFQGGFSTQTPHLGLPEMDMDAMRRGAKFTDPARSKHGAYFEVTLDDIPGAKVDNSGQPVGPRPPRGDNADPFYTINSAGNRVPFDYRPRIPNVEVTLDGNEVRVQKVSTLDDSHTRLPVVDPKTGTSQVAEITFKADEMATGVLFVDGGNVVINNASIMDGSEAEFNQRMSVVAGNHATRGSNASVTDGLYSKVASKIYDYEKARWDISKQLDPNAVATSANKTPPYTKEDIRQVIDFAANHNVVPRPTPGQPNPSPLSLNLTPEELAEYQSMPSGRASWPAPPEGVEREGNLVVGGDVKAQKTASTKLGLFAENFITINGNPANNGDNELIVDATMMSRNKTITLDWDNLARLDPQRWKTLMDPNFKGKLSLNGAIVGRFIDIEGDNQGRGYVNQNFHHNPYLREERPPFTPIWDFSVLPGGFRFIVTHFTDRGAINTDKAL